MRAEVGFFPFRPQGPLGDEGLEPADVPLRGAWCQAADGAWWSRYRRHATSSERD
jgi:hypothetical protein